MSNKEPFCNKYKKPVDKIEANECRDSCSECRYFTVVKKNKDSGSNPCTTKVR